MKEIEIYVGEEDNERLDYYLSLELDEVSRTRIQKLVKDQLVKVNGSIKKSSYIVKEGDTISVVFPEPKKLEITPEDIPLEIVFEDSDLAVVNKRHGMVVHPAPGNYSGTLVNALMFHMDNLSSINGIIRPGIVHRLDKDTSGLLVIAKNDKTHRGLSEQLKHHGVYREYVALVHGNIRQDTGTIDAPIGRNQKDRKKMAVTGKNSKEAITHFSVSKRYGKYTLVTLRLETGRTHQIRVHLSHMGNPVVGDPVYSGGKNEFKIERQLLHARRLGFIHPSTNENVEFSCDLPEDFKLILERLDKEAQL
ncbi:MAG TPA: RluA family pseudouridine synthase [Tissierellaceae bacterium]|nr:RluA family pseudouridine synthase [Tissierellaceae bacterium]